MDAESLPEGPLTGYKIVDFTRILSGPFATMLLADLGADVIKVERPDQGDDTRSWGPPFWHDTSAYFAAVNRGKRSIAVDLRTESGRDAVKRLVAGADVVVENFRPGVTDRLGISYPELAQLKPDLIYASITGFGSWGPRADDAGTEVIIEAESGLMSMTGVPDGDPVRFGVAMVDIAAGLSLVSGVLAAIIQRSRTGQGQQLEFPLFSTAISVLATAITSASVAPETQQSRFGSGHPSIVPYSAFETSDGWVVLGAVNDRMWAKLIDALGLGEVIDPERSSSNSMRVSNRSYVEQVIAEAVIDRTMDEVVGKLGPRGVLVARVRSVSEAVRDPQVDELGILDKDDGVLFARTPLAGFNPKQLSRAPSLGQHSREVLQEAGVDSSRINELLADQAVAKD